MKFEVKSDILGFENLKEVEFGEIDELFSTLRSCTDENITFTLVNPNVLRDYAFELSSATEALLEIKDNADLMVFNIMIIQNPLDESKVNFQAPLIFNKKNKTMAQEVLGFQKYPQYGFDESLKTYISS